jgi:outer membrane protein OmpA-like peptidoglycan-associated protein
MARPATFPLLLLALLPTAGLAQVNQHALDQLGPAHKPALAARPHPGHPSHQAAVSHPKLHPTTHATSAVAHPPATHAEHVARIGKAPSIPLHPPPPPIIAPPALRVVLHPPPPPPAVPIDPKAQGTATPLGHGFRITFGPDSAAVNASTDEALHGVAAMLKAEPQSVADIDAYAAGTPDDPSTPRRTSLQRALAARAVLINDGISSTRIYARALGSAPSTTADPADRLDITVRDPNVSSGTTAAR